MAPQQRRERARGQDRPVGPHDAAGRVGLEVVPGRDEALDDGRLVDHAAEAGHGVGQPPARAAPGRARVVVALPQAAEVASARRSPRAPRRDRAAAAPRRARRAPAPPRRRPASSCSRVATRSSPAVSRWQSIRGVSIVARHAVDVLAAETLERRHLAGPAGEAVADPVRQRRRAEPAVASGRSAGDAVGLEQHDARTGPLLQGLQRRPQPGQAAADDEQVGVDALAQRRARGGGVGRREPVRSRLGVGERGEQIHAVSDQRCRDQDRLIITCFDRRR